MSINWRSRYQQAGNLARAIVAKRVTLLAAAGIILGELVRDGVVPDGLANGVTHWATVAFTVAGVVTGVLWAQSGTTPADPSLHPVDIHGNDLVSALTVGPHAGIEDTSADASAAFAAAATIHVADPTASLPDPTLPTADPAAMGGQAVTSPTTPQGA